MPRRTTQVPASPDQSEFRINGDVLRRARELAGFDIETAAKKLRINIQVLESWESGASRPTLIQLEKVSQTFKRPYAFFFLADFDDDGYPQPKRRVSHGIDRFYHASPEALLQLRSAVSRRDTIISVHEELGKRVTSFRPNLSSKSKPDSIAQELRELLGISIEAQRNFKDEWEALRNWKFEIEKLGVFVTQISKVGVSEMRGFSLHFDRMPIVAVNSKDTPNARIFTLIHELCHLAIGDDGICSFGYARENFVDSHSEEVLCNRVAASLLLPQPALFADPLVAKKTNPNDWSLREVTILANTYKVSREVMIIRLNSIQRLSEQLSERLLAEVRKSYKPRKSGFASIAQRCLLRWGETFSRVVIQAHHNESITPSRAAESLGIRIKEISNVEALLSVRS